MRLVAYLRSFLLVLGRAFTHEWFPALLALWRRLWEIIRAWWGRHQAGRAAKASEARCNAIDEPAFHRPDPMLYAQYDLMAQGFAVTWDNPDIVVRKGGAPVPSSVLEPDTEYEVVARIWNKAPDAPVVGLPVRFSYLSFGNGVQGHAIGATAVNLGVKGGPDHPAFARMKWTTPRERGHYCLLVLLEPVDDLDFGNNLGQENLLVGQPHSPAEFTFRLRNEETREQAFRFEVDTYSLPELPPCDQREPRPPPANATDRPAVAPRHDRRNYPIPSGWSVALEPDEPRLAPGEEMPIRVRITAPAEFRGRQPFNVNAFDRDGFAGGVTLVVEAP